MKNKFFIPILLAGLFFTLHHTYAADGNSQPLAGTTWLYHQTDESTYGDEYSKEDTYLSFTLGKTFFYITYTQMINGEVQNYESKTGKYTYQHPVLTLTVTEGDSVESERLTLSEDGNYLTADEDDMIFVKQP